MHSRPSMCVECACLHICSTQLTLMLYLPGKVLHEWLNHCDALYESANPQRLLFISKFVLSLHFLPLISSPPYLSIT